MGQALYTSVTGMKVAQTQINVVANNIANVNTAGFKESNVYFSDIYYNTLTTGSSPTRYNGGTNPKQIGTGAQVAAIGKNFNGGSVNTTGVTTDMNIQGNGFFTIINPNKDIFYTRAGNFTLDADGYLCMGNGFRVIGTPTVFSTTSSDTPIHIPVLIEGKTSPNTTNLGVKPLNTLNGCSISEGSFEITVTDYSGAVPTDINPPFTINIGPNATMDSIVASINAALDPVGGPSYATASLANGKLSIAGGADFALTFKAGDSNFVGETTIATVPPARGATYSTKILDYKQTINDAADMKTALELDQIDVSENGAIIAKYSNGDQLTVELNENTDLYEFKYTTAKGIVITGADLNVPAGIAVPANFQMQLSNFTNVNGLVSKGSSIFTSGPNCGQAFFGSPATNGFGVMNTGAYESSNVDLTKQFSDMIMAQRAIEANSRVFTTQNQVLQALNYLGQ